MEPERVDHTASNTVVEQMLPPRKKLEHYDPFDAQMTLSQALPLIDPLRYQCQMPVTILEDPQINIRFNQSIHSRFMESIPKRKGSNDGVPPTYFLRGRFDSPEK